MKKKSLFGIIGCGLLIGATIYLVIKSVNKDSVNKHNEELLNEKDSMDISPEHITEDNAVDLDEIKMQSANSMYDRHKAAAQVVKESMEKINENPDLPSEHEEEFYSMLEELDMLSE
ncbi:hypothetical protein NNC19_12935 [Clostridium sp. SHJSY1]|uniref:hypothetical protein n=1 Tax=Clostridium sp. SHJSY1 TaxID=2942483 RepID=UPI002876D8D3|nr:hypothetical protein [Clostridium sp. SHJSY1]MDS0526590.1 hypothetical protein [Clostridium sp. SHJSY1]